MAVEASFRLRASDQRCVQGFVLGTLWLIIFIYDLDENIGGVILDDTKI